MFNRPFLDNKKTYKNKEFIDIKKNPLFNNKTNFYDNMRISSFEQQPPDARGYKNIPLVNNKQNLFKSKFNKIKERSILMEIALNKDLLLPLLDDLGNTMIDSKNKKLILMNYNFNEIITKKKNLVPYALNYLNSLQDNEFANSPEFLLMLELLLPTTKKNTEKNINMTEEEMNESIKNLELKRRKNMLLYKNKPDNIFEDKNTNFSLSGLIKYSSDLLKNYTSKSFNSYV